MTIIEVVLIGAAVLLIASALDNTPIVSTFQKIISNQPIDWSGNAGGVTFNQNTGAATAVAVVNPAVPDKNGNCPPGRINVFGYCVQIG